MTKAAHSFLLLLLATLGACAPPSDPLRPSRPLSADCLTDFTTLNRNERRCGISLGPDGSVTVGGIRREPLLVGVTTAAAVETRQYATSLLLFPASPSHRFVFAVGCAEDGLCWAPFVFDLQEGIARKTVAGRYGPEKFIAWSPDGSRAALLYRAEGASWLYVVDGRTGVSFNDPAYGAAKSYGYRERELIWLSNAELRIPVRECPPDAGCASAEGGYAERSFAVSGEGLRPR